MTTNNYNNSLLTGLTIDPEYMQKYPDIELTPLQQELWSDPIIDEPDIPFSSNNNNNSTNSRPIKKIIETCVIDLEKNTKECQTKFDYGNNYIRYQSNQRTIEGFNTGSPINTIILILISLFIVVLIFWR